MYATVIKWEKLNCLFSPFVAAYFHGVLCIVYALAMFGGVNNFPGVKSFKSNLMLYIWQTEQQSRDPLQLGQTEKNCMCLRYHENS